MNESAILCEMCFRQMLPQEVTHDVLRKQLCPHCACGVADIAASLLAIAPRNRTANLEALASLYVTAAEAVIYNYTVQEAYRDSL